MSTCNRDFEDVVLALEEAGAEFVIVGAYAMAVHGIPRATGDLDVFVRPSLENAPRVYRGLSRFGAPLEAHGVVAEDFARPDTVYQIGLPPGRIDVITAISGVAFDEAMQGSVEAHLGRARARFIGRAALIRNKRASARPKDLLDADLLEGKRKD